MNYIVIFIPIIQHRSSIKKEMSEKWNKAFLLIAVVININIFYSWGIYMILMANFNKKEPNRREKWNWNWKLNSHKIPIEIVRIVQISPLKMMIFCCCLFPLLLFYPLIFIWQSMYSFPTKRIPTFNMIYIMKFMNPPNKTLILFPLPTKLVNIHSNNKTNKKKALKHSKRTKGEFIN